MQFGSVEEIICRSSFNKNKLEKDFDLQAQVRYFLVFCKQFLGNFKGFFWQFFEIFLGIFWKFCGNSLEIGNFLGIL